MKLLQQVFGWVDDAYDKIPVERRSPGGPAYGREPSYEAGMRFHAASRHA
jgi:hypothetical protein